MEILAFSGPSSMNRPTRAGAAGMVIERGNSRLRPLRCPMTDAAQWIGNGYPAHAFFFAERQ